MRLGQALQRLKRRGRVHRVRPPIGDGDRDTGCGLGLAGRDRFANRLDHASVILSLPLDNWQGRDAHELQDAV